MPYVKANAKFFVSPIWHSVDKGCSQNSLLHIFFFFHETHENNGKICISSVYIFDMNSYKDIFTEKLKILDVCPKLKWLCKVDKYDLYDVSGHGFKMAPVTGRILAELALGKRPTYDLTPFRMDRFHNKAKLWARTITCTIKTDQ